MLVLTPEPASWGTWCSVIGNRRNAHMASVRAVGDRKSPADPSAQRAKLRSAGGDMAAFSPASGMKRELPTMWPPRTTRQLGVGPSLGGRIVEEKYGRIL